MPKSRKGRKKKKASNTSKITRPSRELSSKIQSEHIQTLLDIPYSQRRWFRILRLVFGGLLAATGLTASLYSIFGGPLWPVAPEIETSAPSYSSPFAVPFIIRNPSVLFSIIDPHLNCIYSYVVSDQHSEIQGPLNVTAEGTNDPILPKGARPYRCPFPFYFLDRPGGTQRGKVIGTQVNITVQYVSPIIGSKETVVGPFTWDGNLDPPRWVKGPPLR